jgi:prolycopene isomerase
MKIVVIGAGAAGLTTGAALAKAGHEVTILDHNEQPGGVISGWQKNGFRWDLGQLLVEGLGKDEPTGEILVALGIFDEVKTIRDDRRYVFPDFSIDKPQNYAGLIWRMDFLKNIFPEDSVGLDRYWKDYQRFTHLMTIVRKLNHTSGLQLRWLKLQLLLSLLPFLTRQKWSAQRLMESYFKSNKLQAVFISILADFFTPPSQFLGLGVFALNPEPSFDSRMEKQLGKNSDQLYFYSLLGGTRSLVDPLVTCIQQHGGSLRMQTDIVKIQVENGKVSGVRTANGEFIAADIVVASGAANETFLNLVGEEHLPSNFVNEVSELPLMDSVFMVHLGLDYDPAVHTGGVCTYYYGTYDIEAGILEAKQQRYHQGKQGFVVHLPTNHSPEMAPQGFHAMTVYTICPDQLADGDWQSQKDQFADQLIAYAEEHIPQLSAHIVSREIISPVEFREITQCKHHAFGGLAPVMDKHGIAHQTPIEGLWFIGQQSEGGGGLGNVITNAYNTAQTIIKTV